jgi:hypothetical protein
MRPYLLVTLIMGLIFTDQTTLARDVHPGLAFCTLWISVLWLTMVEGSQGWSVLLLDKELFKDSQSLTSAVKLPTRATTSIGTSWVVSSWLL